MLDNLKQFLISHISKNYILYSFLVILVAILPTGSLSGNEEMYYGLAKKFLDEAWNGDYSSFLLSGDYRFLSDFLIGTMIKLLGFENTQIIGSFIASALYTYAIYKIFKELSLDDINGILILIIFILLGQSFIGREWLFEDFEAKIFSYFFVLLGLHQYLKGNFFKLSINLSMATYFHLLVGASWFVLLFTTLLFTEKRHFNVIKNSFYYFLFSFPIIFIAYLGFMGSTFVQDPNLPSPDYIYSYIRQYKMVLPFYSLSSFVITWLPGILIYFGFLLSIVFIRRDKDIFLEKLFYIILTSSFALFGLIFLSFFDVDGFLGKFYPFRFASLLLLIFIIFYARYLLLYFNNFSRSLSFSVLLILSPFFFIKASINAVGELQDVYFENKNKINLYEFVEENTNPSHIILIDPRLEEIFFDFERKLNRPTLVTFKYIPSSKEGLIEWYKRREFKTKIFNGDFEIIHQFPFHYLLLKKDKEMPHLTSSFNKVFENQEFYLLQYKAAIQKSSIKME